MCLHWYGGTTIPIAHLFIGKGGYYGDGDITKPDNLIEFQQYVLEQTEQQGVHFVMADGVRGDGVGLSVCLSCASERYAHTIEALLSLIL